MAQRTDLQEVLKDDMLVRDFQTVDSLFREGGIKLWDEIVGALGESFRESTDDFVLLEAGCGSGACLEQILRNLMQRFPQFKARIKAIGVDVNPLPEMIPQRILGVNPDAGFSMFNLFGDGDSLQVPNTPLADLRMGDVCALDLPDESVNIGYSVATLIYVADTLRAFSEGYRVLKPGGKFFWEICKKDISLFPDFDQILEATPGAKQVFSYVLSSVDENTGFVICNKTAGIEFKGFDYAVDRDVRFDNADSHRVFYRNAVYCAVPQVDPGVGKGRPNRRVDKPPAQRFEQFLERVLADAERGKFPIGFRGRDCERFNQFPMRLNACFDRGDIAGLRTEIAGIARILMSVDA